MPQCHKCQLFTAKIFHDVDTKRVIAGYCKARPPVPVTQAMPLTLPDGSLAFESTFPIVTADNHCGHFRNRVV